jgi:alkaline phosphatase D
MLSRRHFLRLSSGVVLSTAVTGCTLGGRQPALSAARFDHGVASGDPLADGILLWTRATPVPGAGDTGTGPVSVAWELAADEAFREVLRDGVTDTGPARDFTVKIDVRDLEPGQTYYYRFRAAGAVSATGRARTLPAAGAREVRLAVFSCSNYPAGYFYPYREAARRDDLDAFLHLGDYFYEYGAGGYATERSEELGRALPADNAGELYTLTDYRRRYALYRGDADLQAMHAAAPCISVWDDHEFANDAWREGAQNHGPDEGDWQPRMMAALQAYYEWMPIRPPAGEGSLRIYRSFDFGGLVALHMLDTRLIGRDEQLEYAHYIDEATGQLDRDRFLADLGSPTRRLLGDSQRDWLAAQLAQSSAPWQLLGQQILMARMLMPAEMLGAASYADIPPILGELARLKAAAEAGQSLSDTELARLSAVTPYNLDAWDGYPVERELLYGAARAAGKRIVSLAGDTHNAWYSTLRDRSGTAVGIELATPSVSSPGMEAYFQMDAPTAIRMAEAMPLLIDELNYCNLHQRGYLLVTATPDELRADWTFVDSVQTPEYAIAGTHTERFARG